MKKKIYKVILGNGKKIKIKEFNTLEEAQEFAKKNLNEFGTYDIVEVTVIEKTIESKLEWI